MKYTTLILALFLLGCSKDDSDLIKSNIFGQGTYTPNPNANDPLTVSASTLDFGTVNVGSFVRLKLTVSNISNKEVTFSSVQDCFAPFESPIHSGINYLANSSEDYYIYFRPTSEGTYTGTIVLNYGGYSKTIQLKGKTPNSSGGGGGSGTPILTYPAGGTLNFGDVYVGSTASKTISIQNTGTADAIWTNSRTEYTSNPSSGTISVGGSQNIDISYTPTSSGTYTNNIVLAYNNKTLVIPYTANRIAANRIINLNTSSTNFGNVPKNTTQTKTLTISNTGSQSLNITSVTISGTTGVWTVDNYIGSIPAGGSVNVNVNFKPISSFNYNGIITVNSNKTSGVNTITFTGKGI